MNVVSVVNNIDTNEVIIITVALVTLTTAVMVNSIQENTYSALIGTFLGYTFGRIFNHAQGKE